MVCDAPRMDVQDVNAQLAGLFGDTAPLFASTEPEDLMVWPENWEAVRLFSAVQTQWRRDVGMGGVVAFGLDYSAVKTVMDLMLDSRVDKADVFRRLQVMEQEALGVLNK